MTEKTANIIVEVADERAAQDRKWGEQNHDLPKWVVILGEEFGEVCDAVCRYTFETGAADIHIAAAHTRKECIQVAAVAVAMVEYIDRHKLCGE